MGRSGILLVAAALFTVPPVSRAEEQAKKLGVSLGVDYVSKWIFNGREVWSEDGGFFETINLDLWGTGFGVAYTHRSALGSGNLDRGGNVNRQRMDYMFAYGGSAFDAEPYEVKYKVSYMSKNWYDKLANAAGKSLDCETWTLKYSLPNLLGSTGLVPYGITNYTEPADSHDGWGKHWNGCVHRLGLGYDLSVPSLESPLHLSSDIAYNDGFCRGDHEWAFATVGASTKTKLSENMMFVPAVYHQISMDDSLTDHDVTYCVLSMKYEF